MTKTREKKWLIVCDDSGHHRAMSKSWLELNGLGLGTFHIVDEAHHYLGACRLADKLNEVSNVMGS
jgi:hypothetical protein